MHMMTMTTGQLAEELLHRRHNHNHNEGAIHGSTTPRNMMSRSELSPKKRCANTSTKMASDSLIRHREEAMMEVGVPVAIRAMMIMMTDPAIPRMSPDGSIIARYEKHECHESRI